MKTLLSLFCLVACHPFWQPAAIPINAVIAGTTPLAAVQPLPTTPVQFVNQTGTTLFPTTINGDYCWVTDRPPYPLAAHTAGPIINVTKNIGCKVAKPKPWTVTYGPKSSTSAAASCETAINYVGVSPAKPYSISTINSAALRCTLMPRWMEANVITISPANGSI